MTPICPLHNPLSMGSAGRASSSRSQTDIYYLSGSAAVTCVPVCLCDRSGEKPYSQVLKTERAVQTPVESGRRELLSASSSNVELKVRMEAVDDRRISSSLHSGVAVTIRGFWMAPAVHFATILGVHFVTTSCEACLSLTDAL